jgi:predicted nucleic acid-binding protein
VRVYIDSNVFIYGMETDYDQGLRARRCLHQIERNEFDALTSELTLAEVLRGGNAQLRPKLFEGYVRLLANQPSLCVLPVTREILIASARLETVRKIELADAIHVATALVSGCEAFLTEDKRMPVPAEMKKLSLADWIPQL